MKNEKTLNDKTYLNCYKKNIITFDSLPEHLKKEIINEIQNKKWKDARAFR